MRGKSQTQDSEDFLDLSGVELNFRLRQFVFDLVDPNNPDVAYFFGDTAPVARTGKCKKSAYRDRVCQIRDGRLDHFNLARNTVERACPTEPPGVDPVILEFD